MKWLVVLPEKGDFEMLMVQQIVSGKSTYDFFLLISKKIT